MLLTLLEFIVLVAFAVYVEWWRAGERRRQAQVWDRLAAQLQPNWYGERLSDQLEGQFSWKPDQDSTPEQRWLKVQGTHGLWSMYENARVMLDMAEYAARNSDTVDKEMLMALRKDAMEIRVCVLISLSKLACDKVNESTCANVSRAASLYADMAARMTELMRRQGGVVAPSFAGTM
ncbi:MAG TPA: hypothetical protein VMW15_09090 [Terracidiphilus sp.]|nr:hypothetical protein [Terracidiphilus sp.]